MQTEDFCVANVVISNPKLYATPATTQESRLFPYYAGYSADFAHKVLSSLPLTPGSVVFDPWNGSGTTTHAAYRLGHKAVGFDLNPAMIIAAKAGMLSQLEFPSLLPIAHSIVEQASTQDQIGDDPLLQWLAPDSVRSIRKIEAAINRTLICNEAYVRINTNEALERVSPLAAFFYVSLFRSVRRLLSDFIPSNPTWIKKPKNFAQRKRPGEPKIQNFFINEVENLANSGSVLRNEKPPNDNEVILRIGNAEDIPLLDQSVDAIVSSPPYCTRIDYAISTSIELAIIRVNHSEFDSLRRKLTGTSTVSAERDQLDPSWGGTCLSFLEKLHAHPSKASQGYYYKNHIQYFKSLARSLNEISRVLKRRSYCILVAQDSYYKELHNDVPGMTVEMASTGGLELVRRLDFSSGRSMVGINGRSRKYLHSRITTESVLCFQRA